MHTAKSPIRQMREKLQLTQTQFAAVTGVSKGHMSEVETGIAPLSEKIKEFLRELSIDVEKVEKEHNVYMEYRRQQYRAIAAERAAQAEDQHQEEGG